MSSWCGALVVALVARAASGQLCSSDNLIVENLTPRGHSLYASPWAPTSADSVSLMIVDWDQCYGIERETLTIEDSTITIDVTIRRVSICLAVYKPWMIRRCLAPLDEGAYEIVKKEVRIDREGAVDTTISRFGLTVRDSEAAQGAYDLRWMGPDDEYHEFTGNAGVGADRRLRVFASSPALRPERLVVDVPAALTAVSFEAGEGCSVDSPDPHQIAIDCEAAQDTTGAIVATGLVTVTSPLTGMADVRLRYESDATSRESLARAMPWPIERQGLFDVDWDHVVDLDDYFRFADAFGGTDPAYDGNADGVIDWDDFFGFADRYRTSYDRDYVILFGDE